MPGGLVGTDTEPDAGGAEEDSRHYSLSSLADCVKFWLKEGGRAASGAATGRGPAPRTRSSLRTPSQPTAPLLSAISAHRSPVPIRHPPQTLARTPARSLCMGRTARLQRCLTQA